jgi:hypothetical protein
MKRIIILAIVIIIGTSGWAQKKQEEAKKERTTKLWGHVFDSFNNRALCGALITLMHDDSTFVDTVRTWSADSYSSYYFTIPAKPQKFIIKAEMEGYEPCFIHYEIKHVARNTFFDAPWHYMKKKVVYSRELKEVVVKASKVQIVYRGDTLIYNADAFNIPEGSMLEDLIKQMPGVTLKDNGEITVNGTKVAYLTLNGANFFKGNNKMMLENLPYYTVKKVKVFNKTTDKSKFLGYDAEKKEYVMDVILKREYSVGTLGNIEGSLGSSDRWLARAFGLRYSDHSRLTAFGNMNNTNETRRPGSDGDWEPSSSPVGLTTYKEVNANLFTEDADRRWQNEASARVYGTKTENESRTASAMYLQSGSSFSRLMSNSLDNNWNTELTNRFLMDKPTRPVYFEQNTSYNYAHTNNRALSRNAVFNSDPESLGSTKTILDSVFANGALWRKGLLNQLLNENRYKGNNWHIGQNNKLTWKLPWGDNLEFELGGNYDKSSNDIFSHYYLDYTSEVQNNSHRNKYGPQEAKSYSWNTSAQYTFNFLSGWHLGLFYQYIQKYSSNDNPLYRLERDSVWQSLNPVLGSLPDNGVGQSFLDNENSMEYSTLSRYNEFCPWFNYSKSDSVVYERLLIKLPLKMERNHERYIRNTTDALVRQNKFYIDPIISYTRELIKKKIYFYAQASLETKLPNIDNLVGYKDSTSNPLSIKIGNPDVEPSQTYLFYSTLNHWDEHGSSFFLYLAGRFIHNEITTGYTYDAKKGAYTFQDKNINGSWGVAIMNDYSRAIGDNKHWRIGSYLLLSYENQASYGTDMSNSLLDVTKINVHRTDLEERLSVSFRLNDKFDVTPSGKIKYEHSSSDLSTYKNMNVYNLIYGMNLHWQMPLGLQLATDINMYNRRGYQDEQMNTNNLIWNAQLSKSFFKKKVTAKIEAFDILNKITDTYMNVSSSGYTSTWSRSLPRYVMFHLIYKFSKMPKKK